MKIPILLLIFTFLLNASNGKELYKQCASCHGINGDKMAMGSSKKIRGWSVLRLEKVLIGYKNGTYGFCLKNYMQAEVRHLSLDDIKTLSVHINKL